MEMHEDLGNDLKEFGQLVQGLVNGVNPVDQKFNCLFYSGFAIV